jgi:hypothetical protein
MGKGRIDLLQDSLTQATSLPAYPPPAQISFRRVKDRLAFSKELGGRSFGVHNQPHFN